MGLHLFFNNKYIAFISVRIMKQEKGKHKSPIVCMMGHGEDPRSLFTSFPSNGIAIIKWYSFKQTTVSTQNI